MRVRKDWQGDADWPHEVFFEACDWLTDCGADLPVTMTISEIQAEVDHRYQGGWAQFLFDQDIPGGVLP